MTTETKLGLLLGMGVIILVGIFISDHLSKANNQEAAELTGPLGEVDMPSVLSNGGGDGDGGDVAVRQPEPEPRSQSSARSSREQQPQSTETETARDDSRSRANVLNIDLRDAIILEERGQRGVEIDGDGRLVDREVDRIVQGSREVPEGFEYVGEVPQEQPVDLSDLRGDRDNSSEQADRSSSSQEETADTEQDSGSDPIIHYVQENENLSKIAQKYYGNSGYYRMIYEANRDTLPNPDRLRPGVRLVIPDEAGTVVARQSSGASSSESRSSSSATRSYTVRENDTLWGLAQQFYGSGARSDELLELNADRISNPDRLSVGDEILVPVR